MPSALISQFKKTDRNQSLQLIFFFFTFVLLILFVIAPIINNYWAPADDSYYIHTAERLLSGEVLNKDIQSRHFGYIHFINAASMWFLGDNLTSTRIGLLSMLAFSAWLTFLLFKDEDPILLITGTIISIVFNAFMAPTPNAHWYCFPLTLLIAVLLKRNEDISLNKIILIGFISGIITGLHQLTGIVIAIAALTWFLIKFSNSKQNDDSCVSSLIIPVTLFFAILLYAIKFYLGVFDFILIDLWALLLFVWAAQNIRLTLSNSLKITGIFVFGILLGLTPLFIYHLYHGSFLNFLDDTIFRAGSMTALPYLKESSFAFYLLAGVNYLQNASSITEVLNAVFWIILPVVPLIAGLCFLKAIKFKLEVPSILYFSLAYSLVADVYRIHIFLYYIISISLLSLIYVERNTRLKIPVCILCIFLSGIAGVYHEGQGVYRSIWTGEKPELVSSLLPHINVNVDRMMLENYTKLKEIIDLNSAPNSPILSLPYAPEVYVVTDRKNPFRFSCGADAIQNSEDIEFIKTKLLSLAPTLFIYDSKSKYNTTSQSELVLWIMDRCIKLGDSNTYDVYKFN